ncbi:endonuclease [Cronobacter phage vB_CsaM_GAP32]|uniref:Uncharacterized protein n=1 Tax=Cronobacter phage vB_CsaM_GAP32 TaxID=1141136 RepID=K4FB54_9CAUD|nr:endonuclease [Cronobacter phage vB_CsaM_GAP32]AFC21749.1 hypothetical protein GAP32_299 [Cronobacter phage vB_CsaM_GAP32]
MTLSRNEVISRFIEKHGELYNYNDFVYNGMRTKSKINCILHGDFLQAPHAHIRGQGCPKCGTIKNHKNKSSSTQEQRKRNFITKSNIVHNDKYCYEEVIYKTRNDYVKIYCPDCQKYFLQKPKIHIEGKGCNLCHKHGYNNNINGHFYIHKITYLNDIIAYKFGITNKSVLQRLKQINASSKYEHDIIFQFNDTGQNIRNLETYILKNIDHQFLTKSELYDGYTETICPSNLELLENLIINFITN